MTRTGSQAFSFLVFLAVMLGLSGDLRGQSDRWETQGTSSRQSSYEYADSSAARWKSTRPESDYTQSPDEAADRSAAPKTWLPPTRSSRAKAAAAQSRPASQANQSAARPPKPFVAPADAEPMADADEPGSAAVASRPKGNANASAAQASQSAGSVRSNSARNPYSNPRSPRDRVAQRPQPSAPTNQLFNNSRLRPLKQAAYQAAEPEELYAPPGEAMQMPMQGSPMVGPEYQPDGQWIGPPVGGPSCDGYCGPMCGDGVGCCSTCDEGEADLCSLGPHDDESCHTIRVRVPKCQEVMVLAGVHGFKGPYDQDRDSGNFGFQEGVNIGAKVPFADWGYQYGFEATQSQLSGDGDTGIADSFPQYFVTAGMFRRTRDGLQGGVVWDLLVDERDSTVAFSQLRGEFGFVDCGCHEVGLMVAVHLRDYLSSEVQNEQTIYTTFQSADQYLAYYRMHGERGGEGRVYAGITDDADGIVGADFLVPLTDYWSLQPAFTYLIPAITAAPAPPAKRPGTSASTWSGTGRATPARATRARTGRCSTSPTTAR